MGCVEDLVLIGDVDKKEDFKFGRDSQIKWRKRTMLLLFVAGTGCYHCESYPPNVMVVWPLDIGREDEHSVLTGRKTSG